MSLCLSPVPSPSLGSQPTAIWAAGQALLGCIQDLLINMEVLVGLSTAMRSEGL